jgi:HSP20 family molecular chaperone IbpA
MPNMVLTTRRNVSGHDLRQDPFATFDAVFRRAFPPSSRWTLGPVPTRAAFTPAAEIVKDGQDGLVRVELPGVDLATDVTVEVDRGRLVISGERRDERPDDGTRALREMRYGSFRRVFALPERIDADAIAASYDAGVLTVRVVGAYSAPAPRTIPVTAGSAGPAGSADAPTADAPTGGPETDTSVDSPSEG